MRLEDLQEGVGDFTRERRKKRKVIDVSLCRREKGRRGGALKRCMERRLRYRKWKTRKKEMLQRLVSRREKERRQQN